MIEIDRELLERLAPPEPINQDEQGGCVWCDGSPLMYYKNGVQMTILGSPKRESYGYATSNPDDHFPGCAWLEARKLLESYE